MGNFRSKWRLGDITKINMFSLRSGKWRVVVRFKDKNGNQKRKDYQATDKEHAHWIIERINANN